MAPWRKRFPAFLLLALSGIGGIGAATFPGMPANAQTVEQFYKGRTITLYVASAPGGINDLTARLIAKHMPNFLAGKPTIVVQNLAGANGLALANRLYVNAEKDGSVIAILERGTPQLAIQGDPNVRFDPLKLTWLGSVSSYANDAYLLQVNASFPAKTVADLEKPGTPARLGTTGAGATNLCGGGGRLPGAAARRGRRADQRGERAKGRPEVAVGGRGVSPAGGVQPHHPPA
jgi:tripartite-type tricarboxylate transporter receptor subunit TctC